MLNLNRRSFLQGMGMLLPLPLLEANTKQDKKPPLRLVIVGNPYGMHPESFFPKTFGKDFETSVELKMFEWIRDRFTVFSHPDHNMESGHFRTAAFLSGILPQEAGRYPDGNISIDQLIGEYQRSEVRFPTLNIGMGKGIKESWTRTGVPAPMLKVDQLYKKIFVSSSKAEKVAQNKTWSHNRRMLDAIQGQYKDLSKSIGREDKSRMDQYLTSVSELNREIDSMEKWQSQRKPKFTGDLKKATMQEEYNTLFDMLAVALQSDSSRIATVAFSADMKTRDLGLTSNYHSYTHNGKVQSGVEGMQTIDKVQLSQVNRFMKKLDAIPEPHSNGSMLDHTIVMFGSSMGYGGTHSNRNLPILLGGGGLKHAGHVDLLPKNGTNTPLCNLYLSFLHKFGIDREVFNKSTGTVAI